VFSTAPSPVHATELHGQLVRAYAADEARARLLVASDRLRARLARAGLPLVPGSHGPIVGLVLGSAERALELARRAGEEGVLLQAIRPPTVPAGASRVRLTLTALLDEPSLERLGDVLIRCYQELA
jgi:8-amino-7-oxononanoate synthase